jgi:glycerol-3-phosphate dehydrogenase
MHDVDAVIVGGGFQGVMMALVLAQRGQRPLLIEGARLGAGASSASLGIIHGGLRYLQSLDLPRWRRSRREQAWFRDKFARHVAPIECVMPIYRGRLRSRALFRAAFALEGAAAAIAKLPDRLTGGRIVSAEAAASLYPVEREGLVGGAVWQELALSDPGALLADAARRIGQAGGQVLEGAEFTGMGVVDGRVVSADFNADGARQTVATDAVMLCVGAASRMLARRLDRDIPALSARVLAFNLLFDHPAVPERMLAVSSVAGKGRSYFLREAGGRLLAGTWYTPASDEEASAPPVTVPPDLIAEFRRELEAALPWLVGVPIVETWAGLLPDRNGDGHALRAHDLLWDHGRHGGPKGLYTLLNTKLTTTHALAEQVADLVSSRLPTGVSLDA